MSGRVINEKPKAPNLKTKLHDHVIFVTSEGYKITFRDPRRFGFMLLYPTKELESLRPFSLLAPEPLGEAALTASAFYAQLKHRSLTIKNALLNQKIIVGLGNIYASEALWQARISPLRAANTLSLKEAKILLREIQHVLKRAIKSGGSTLKDYAQPNGKIGYFQHSFNVYGRERLICGCCRLRPITKIFQGGRATYYCKNCQQ